MKPTIEQIKTELREIVELEKLVTNGPWETDAARGVMDLSGVPICYPFGTMEEEANNATFIATSRNLTPKMAKSLLGLIQYLEVYAIPTDEAQNQLESICKNWQ